MFNVHLAYAGVWLWYCTFFVSCVFSKAGPTRTLSGSIRYRCLDAEQWTPLSIEKNTEGNLILPALWFESQNQSFTETEQLPAGWAYLLKAYLKVWSLCLCLHIYGMELSGWEEDSRLLFRNRAGNNQPTPSVVRIGRARFVRFAIPPAFCRALLCNRPAAAAATEPEAASHAPVAWWWTTTTTRAKLLPCCVQCSCNGQIVKALFWLKTKSL